MDQFEHQMQQEIPRLRRFARALTRDRVRADDLVQNCLTRALAKRHQWQPGTDLRAWLFTILHHQHVSDIRRAVREQRRAEADAAAVALASAEPSVRLELRDLDRAIARLPEDQRRVVLLIGLEEMAYEEAAAVLGVPIGTVRSRLGRARESLRTQLCRPKPPKTPSSGKAVVTLRQPHSEHAAVPA